jgi:hypothetical protein
MVAEYERFLRAVEQQDGEAVIALIRECPQLHDHQGDAGTLVEILHREMPELLEPAFRAGLSPDAGPELPIQTFLQHAVAMGDLEQIQLALHYGADPERRNDWGEVSLGYACSHGQLEAVRMLVEAGAQVNTVEERLETGSRRTPLDSAGGYPEIARYLRAHGAKSYSEIAA